MARGSTVQSVALVDAYGKGAIAQVVEQDPVPSQGMELFERLARDPNASVEKIERLMALWERAEARKAETAFNGAMSVAQEAMNFVSTDKENKQTNSRYASYKALDKAIRPVYTKHGFGLSFNTESTGDKDMVRVLCKVSHLAGHSSHYAIDMPADGKGAKGGDVMTKTHATGSAVTYGMRYLLKMIFNIAVGDEKADDDGNRASRRQERADEPPPERRESRRETKQAAPMPPNPNAGELLTDIQVKRLGSLVRNSGRTKEQFLDWLHLKYKKTATQLTRGEYDEVVAAIEAPGALPA